MHPLDSYRAAKLLLDQHGIDRARAHAEARIADLRRDGDAADMGAWQAILRAMDELSAMQPKGATRH